MLSIVLRIFSLNKPYVHYKSHKVLERVLRISTIREYKTEIKVKKTKQKKENVEPKIEDFNLNNELIKWALESKISLKKFTDLMKVLSAYGIEDLPKNARDLFRMKEVNFQVTNVPPGTYFHIGFQNNLTKLLSQLVQKNLLQGTDINVSIFIDKLPFLTQTNDHFWVILGCVEGFSSLVFAIGAYQGFSNPTCVNLFLSEFIKEATQLCKEGVEVADSHYNIKIKRLICDAPAKAYVLNLKCPIGYSSCTKCDVVGQYENNTMSFPTICKPRLDKHYETDEFYINTKTSFLEIPNFGLVSNVPLDYMHLVCLGVVKKLLSIWMENQEVWLSESALDSFRKYFFTGPRAGKTKKSILVNYSFWNAVQFRDFLLYFGPCILKTTLKPEYYNHFLLLHIACRLLCMEATSKNIDFSKKLLHTFVSNYPKLYKKEAVTHNFHGLYHLADDCVLHGTLDNFSSFYFEKFLLKLKQELYTNRHKLIPQTMLQFATDKILTKSLNTLKLNNLKVKPSKVSTVADNYPNNYSLCSEISIDNDKMNTRLSSDCYVKLKNKKIIKIFDIYKDKDNSSEPFSIFGSEFSSVSNFYSEPYSNFDLDIFLAKDLSKCNKFWPLNMVERSCIALPTETNEFVLIGLLKENY